MTRRHWVLSLLLSGMGFAQDSFSGAPRIVAVGDVHGDYDAFVSVLRAAGVVNGSGKWTGAKTHLVQTGDVVDRGPDSRKVMDLLIELEKQARRAGGYVHSLMGNHEAMDVYGDLRYVSAAEYEAFRTKKSAELREEMMKRSLPEDTKPDDAYKKKWDAEHPLGWIEHRLAFGPEGKYGQWIRKKNVIVKVNDAIFLHGGINPKFAAGTLKEMNERGRAELKDFDKPNGGMLLNGGMIMDDDGPLWFRGLAQEPEEKLAAHLDQVLANFGVKRVVIGHTPQPAVMPRFGGKVIVIDVGLSRVYGGPPACLVIEAGKTQALHRGKLIDLPSDSASLSLYLKTVAALEPPSSPVHKLLQ